MGESQDQFGSGKEDEIEGEETGDRKPGQGTTATVQAKMTKTLNKGTTRDIRKKDSFETT